MPDAIQQIPIEKEYKKNLNITSEDIGKFREWLDTQPHLPGKHLTELDLILVYYCCERSMAVSKEVLDLHFTLRTLFEVFFKNRVYDKKIEFTLNTVLFAPLPTLTLHGYRAIYLRLLDYDARNFFFNDVVRTFMMIFDLWQYEEGTWPGFVITIDMDKATLGHITKLEVMTIKKVLYFVQECMLIKLKEVHFMNAPIFMDKLMMLLRPFLKKALMEIIYIHPVGTDSVYRFIDKEAFPKDDGGSYLSHEAIKEATMKRLKSNPEFFRNENQKRVDETLRPGGAASIQDEFGLQGSFKNLFAPLPTLTLHGYRAIYLRLLDYDARNFFFNDVVRTFMMIFDLWQYEEGTWPGFVITIDMDKATLGHITKLEVMTIKKVLYFVQECMLIKLKEVHFMNAPIFMDKLMMLLRPFLKKALMEIIYIHPVGTDSVYRFIDKEAFPKDDGGSYLSHEAIKEATMKRLKSNPEFFRNENQKRVDETLRPGGAASIQDEFGLQGSFKKLDID